MSQDAFYILRGVGESFGVYAIQSINFHATVNFHKRIHICIKPHPSYLRGTLILRDFKHANDSKNKVLYIIPHNLERHGTAFKSIFISCYSGTNIDVASIPFKF